MNGLWLDLRTRHNPANSGVMLGCCQQLLAKQTNLVTSIHPLGAEGVGFRTFPPTSLSFLPYKLCKRVTGTFWSLFPAISSARLQNKTSLQKRFLYISVLSKTGPYIETEDFPSSQGFL